MAWRELAVLMPMLDKFADSMKPRLIEPLRKGTLKPCNIADVESLSAWAILIRTYP
jgi:hypothetical protein